MVNVFLKRCEQLYYPPSVGALVYECVSKVEQLTRQHRQAETSNLRGSLLDATTSAVHSIRLHSGYQLRSLAEDYKASDIEAQTSRFLDIFQINVSC